MPNQVDGSREIDSLALVPDVNELRFSDVTITFRYIAFGEGNMGRPKVTNEQIAQRAKQFSTRGAFAKGSKSYYNLASQRGILKSVCAHMKSGCHGFVHINSKRRVWTLDDVLTEARKYSTKGDFRKGSRGAYDAAKRDFDFNAVCTHMVKKEPTKDELRAIVAQFDCLKTFRESEGVAYSLIMRKGWGDDLLSGLRRAYRSWSDADLFSEARKYTSRGALQKHSPVAYGIIRRRGLLNETCRHMAPVNNTWTIEKVVESAYQYESRKAFALGEPGAYAFAQQRGQLDLVCSHLPVLRKRWTLEAIREEASKYNSLTEFTRAAPSAYQAAKRLGITDEFFPVLERAQRRLSDADLRNIASNFQTPGEFKRGDPGAHCTAQRRGILKAICTHMRNPRLKWTPEALKAEAKKYSTRSEFQRGSGGAYTVARSLGLIDEICSHMEFAQTNWTDELLALEALKYSRRIDFVRGSPNAYQRAAHRGLLDEICSHMEKGLRTDDNVIYIWRALGETHLGIQLYKVGVTSERLGDVRIRQVAAEYDMDPELVCFQVTDKKASQLEKKILKLGINPGFDADKGGFSEFRAMTDAELDKALRIAQSSSPG